MEGAFSNTATFPGVCRVHLSPVAYLCEVELSTQSHITAEADMGFQLSSIKSDIKRLANMQTMPLFLLIL